MDFDEEGLADAIDYFREQTSINIVLEKDVLELIRDDEDDEMTVALLANKIPLRSALDAALAQLELTTVLRGNMLMVMEEDNRQDRFNSATDFQNNAVPMSHFRPVASYYKIAPRSLDLCSWQCRKPSVFLVAFDQAKCAEIVVAAVNGSTLR